MHELFADPVVMNGLNREPVSGLDEARAMIQGGIAVGGGLGPFISAAAAVCGQA